MKSNRKIIIIKIVSVFHICFLLLSLSNNALGSNFDVYKNKVAYSEVTTAIVTPPPLTPTGPTTPAPPPLTPPPITTSPPPQSTTPAPPSETQTTSPPPETTTPAPTNTPTPTPKSVITSSVTSNTVTTSPKPISTSTPKPATKITQTPYATFSFPTPKKLTIPQRQTTTVAPAKSAPSNLRINTIATKNNTAVWLAWTGVYWADYYVVHVNGISISLKITQNTSITFISLDGLDPGNDYKVYVDAVGEGITKSSPSIEYHYSELTTIVNPVVPPAPPITPSIPPYTVSVPVIEQVTNYYCGPASTLEVLKSLGIEVSGKTISEEQKNLAIKMGTTSDGTYVRNLTDTLNDYVDGADYKYIEAKSNLNYNDFIEIVKGSLDQGRPVILHAKTQYLDYYDEKDRGHYIVVSAVEYKKIDGVGQYYLTLVDPYPSSKYNSKNEKSSFGGVHVVTGGEAYDSVATQPSRYVIYTP